MRHRRENAHPHGNLAPMAIALLETSAQTLINCAMAPTHGSGFLMAARQCVQSAWLKFVRGWREFWSGAGSLRHLLRNFGTTW